MELQRANVEQIHVPQAILSSNSANNMDIKKCRGQAYDGASAMASNKIQSKVSFTISLIYTLQ